MKNIPLKVVDEYLINNLTKLSTERLIIYIVGLSKIKNIQLSAEDIVIECWLVNPQKHSLRGYSSFPDSSTVIKRIGEMKGKKGLLIGSEMTGYKLTEISQSIFQNIEIDLKRGKIVNQKKDSIKKRELTSLEEAPYKRLLKSPAYQKYISNKRNEIVETDFLYFYGISWHAKPSLVMNRLKNIDSIVNRFQTENKILLEVRDLLNKEFQYVKSKLLQGK